MSQREEDETRHDPSLVINPDDNPVDYSAIEEAMQDNTTESTANIVPVKSKEIVDPRTLNKIYHDTLGYKIRCSFEDGQGVIYTLIVGCIGLGVATAITFWIWLTNVIAWVSSQADTILGILGGVLLIALVRGLRSSKSGTVVVKGCPKGPTPGAVKISRH